MSTWDLIEQRLNNQLIPLYVTAEEYAFVKEALSLYVRQRLNEGSAWDLFEQVNEAVSLSVPVKGLTQQQVELLTRKFPELRSKIKQGNTGYFLMVEPNVLQNIRKQLQADSKFQGLGPVEDFIDKATTALQLVQGSSLAQAGRAQPPIFGGKPSDVTPTAAKMTGLNDPSVQGQHLPMAKPAVTPPPARNLPTATLDPAAIGAPPATPFSNKAKVKSQDIAMMKGSDPKSAVQKDITGKLVKPGSEPEEDPTQWSLESRRRMREAIENGKLSKKTGKTGSISLTQEEFDAVMAGQVQSVDISSTAGKFLRSVPGAQVAQAIKKGRAKLLLAGDDPANPHYWVVNI